MWYRFKPYASIAERKLQAQRTLAKLQRKKKQGAAPVIIAGRTIAHSFWGRSWCENLERYSDFANRLPRGRSYLRNGFVLDLQVDGGEVAAKVSGSHLYDVRVRVAALSARRWKALCSDCAGAIDSLVELLQGQFSKAVMERVCQPGQGLFPEPKEIEFACSCPDWAAMCKHVAAVLYGIGARLDERPELLFKLRAVDQTDLVAAASRSLPTSKRSSAQGRVLADDNLAELFGLDLGDGENPAAASVKPGRKRGRAAPVTAQPKRTQPATRSTGRKPGPTVKPRLQAKEKTAGKR